METADLADGRIDRTRGVAAIAGQPAAPDQRQAGDGHLHGRCPSAVGTQRRRAGEGALHGVGADRPGEMGVECRQQSVGLRPGRGRAHDPVPPPGHHVDGAVALAQHQAGRRPEPAPRQHQVDGRRRLGWGSGAAEPAAPGSRWDSSVPVASTTTRARTATGPRTGSSSTAPVTRPTPSGADPLVRSGLGQQPANRCPSQGQGAVRHRRPHHGDGQPSVVDLGLVQLDGPGHPVHRDRRGQPRHGAPRQLSVPGQHPGLTDGEGRGVVQAETRTHGESFHRTAGERNQQGDSAHQVRRRAVQQQIALAAQAGDGGDTDPTEVDQSTVHQGAGPPGAAPAPVARIDQGDPEATGDRVQRDPGADDAATDDEHVEVGRSQLGGGVVEQACHRTAGASVTALVSRR